MESLISDESAMDPEFVLTETARAAPEGAGPMAVMQRGIWLGLSRSWGLAVFVVTAVAAHHWGMSACISGLLLSCIIACLRERCAGVQATGAGMWLTVLHHVSGLSVVATSLSSTMFYLSHGKVHAWLVQHSNDCKLLFPILVLTFITTLFVLGLGPSRLFRMMLYAIIPITFLLVFIGIFAFENSKESIKDLLLTVPSFNEVVQSTALFMVIYSGAVVDKVDVAQRLSPFSLVSIFFLWHNCLMAIFFLFLTVDTKTLHSVEVMITDALTYSPQPLIMKAREFVVTRDGLAVTCIICLSLALVEVLAACQKSVVALAGHLLPAWVARDSRWTGTQLYAITLPGLLGCLLAALFPPLELLKLSTVCYLLSHACDLYSALHRQSQPTFVPKHSAEDVEGGGSYQLLSNAIRIEEESEDSDSDSLSDDSGHSTDTDIDAIVHEYKETVKVVSTLAQQPPAPTVRSGRLHMLGLMFLVVKALAEGYLWTTHPTAAALMALEIAITIAMLCRLPKQCESSWTGRTAHLCVTLCCQLALSVTLLRPALQANAFMALALWIVTGVLFWMFSVPVRRWCLLWDTKHSGNGKGRGRLTTRLCQPMGFRATFHKLSPSDMVPIIR